MTHKSVVSKYNVVHACICASVHVYKCTFLLVFVVHIHLALKYHIRKIFNILTSRWKNWCASYLRTTCTHIKHKRKRYICLTPLNVNCTIHNKVKHYYVVQQDLHNYPLPLLHIHPVLAASQPKRHKTHPTQALPARPKTFHSCYTD